MDETVEHGRNWDPSLAEDFCKRVENVQSDIDAIMDEAKERCAPLKDDIKTIKTEAHDEGLPRREFNALIAERKDIKKANARRSKLNDSEKENYDQMKAKMGMLPELPLFKDDVAAAA